MLSMTMQFVSIVFVHGGETSFPVLLRVLLGDPLVISTSFSDLKSYLKGYLGNMLLKAHFRKHDFESM